jgi:hypothetical protein
MESAVELKIVCRMKASPRRNDLGGKGSVEQRKAKRDGNEENVVIFE